MVSDKVDMSLDDIISSNKRGRGRGGRGRGGGGRGRGGSATRGGSNRQSGGGPVRGGGRGGRGGSFRGNRSTPYNRPTNIPEKWEHDMYDGTGSRNNVQGRKAEGGLSTGTHLQISNLDFGVTESDIKELFTEFGKLKKAIINYDESGRSHGTADVVFERKADALKAFNTYNGVPLDGRAMRIETVLPRVSAATNASFSGRRDTRSSSRPRGGRGNFSNNRGNFSNNRGGNRGSNRGGRGRGRGGGRRNIPSKDDLDKELDSYIESNN